MITNPVKAIGAFCLSCCGDSLTARKECSAPDCALYPFRFGKNPFRASNQTQPSEAQLAVRAAFAERARARMIQKEDSLE